MRRFSRGDFLKSILAASGLSALGSSKALPQSKPALLSGLNYGLGTLPLLIPAETRSVCPENPTGEKGKGGMAIPNPADPDLPFSKAAEDLGQGWKVRPSSGLKAERP